MQGDLQAIPQAALPVSFHPLDESVAPPDQDQYQTPRCSCMSIFGKIGYGFHGKARKVDTFGTIALVEPIPERELLLFQELRPTLEQLQQHQSQPSQESYVIQEILNLPRTNREDSSRRAKNAGTTMRKLVEKAGVKPWDKIVQNLLVTRESELLQSGKYRADAVHAFIGHTVNVFRSNYRADGIVRLQVLFGWREMHAQRVLTRLHLGGRHDELVQLEIVAGLHRPFQRQPETGHHGGPQGTCSLDSQQRHGSDQFR